MEGSTTLKISQRTKGKEGTQEQEIREQEIRLHARQIEIKSITVQNVPAMFHHFDPLEVLNPTRAGPSMPSVPKGELDVRCRWWCRTLRTVWCATSSTTPSGWL